MQLVIAAMPECYGAGSICEFSACKVNSGYMCINVSLPQGKWTVLRRQDKELRSWPGFTASWSKGAALQPGCATRRRDQINSSCKEHTWSTRGSWLAVLAYSSFPRGLLQPSQPHPDPCTPTDGFQQGQPPCAPMR